METRLARYVGGGKVEIVTESLPPVPPGGLLVRTEACGLCSGELMAWYMDRKLPHVLGHEVVGIVEVSEDPRIAVGERVFVHHHAPCGLCEMCESGHDVHCPGWKPNRIHPGGMSERFVVDPEAMTDLFPVPDLRAIDAALIEPLATVVKSVRSGGSPRSAGVIGLGVMGLLHLIWLRHLGIEAVGIDLALARREWATTKGLAVADALRPSSVETVFVCPGSQRAFDAGLATVRPGGTVVMFAPLAPGEDLRVPQEAYFRDLRIVNAYSAGPRDTREAADGIRARAVRAEDVIETFCALDDLPAAYGRMTRGEIVKAMVVFTG